MKYYSGIFVDYYRHFPSFPYKGKTWEIDLELPFSSDLFNNLNTFEDGVTQRTKEVIVIGKNRNNAYEFINLFKSAYSLEECFYFDIDLEATTEQEILNPEKDIFLLGQSFKGISSLRACQIARKASYRIKHQYALHKFHESLRAFPINHYYLSPDNWHTEKYWDDEFFVVPQRLDHVRAATSISLAYSVIEELGFEIRANRNKPSTINGKWNPIVLQDLKDRLIDGKINIEEKFLWTVRDKNTDIEKYKSPPIGEPSPWNDSEVKDRETSIFDAILYVSFLRSKISSHRFGDLVSNLNYYHVHNAQSLARRLLLEALGFWRNYPKMSPQITLSSKNF